MFWDKIGSNMNFSYTIQIEILSITNIQTVLGMLTSYQKWMFGIVKLYVQLNNKKLNYMANQ